MCTGRFTPDPGPLWEGGSSGPLSTPCSRLPGTDPFWCECGVGLLDTSGLVLMRCVSCGSSIWFEMCSSYPYPFDFPGGHWLLVPGVPRRGCLARTCPWWGRLGRSRLSVWDRGRAGLCVRKEVLCSGQGSSSGSSCWTLKIRTSNVFCFFCLFDGRIFHGGCLRPVSVAHRVSRPGPEVPLRRPLPSPLPRKTNFRSLRFMRREP